MKTITLLLPSILSLRTHASIIPTGSGNSSCLRTRQDESFDTNVEVGDSTVSAVWQNNPKSGTNRENHPYTEAFKELFDNIYNMCGSTQCGLDQSKPMQYCAPPINPDIWNGNEEICLEVMGSFGTVSKDDIFNLGRAAFDGSVNRVYTGDSNDPNYPLAQVEESGVNFIHVVTGAGMGGRFGI